RQIEIDLEHAAALVTRPAPRRIDASGDERVALTFELRAIDLLAIAVARTLECLHSIAIGIELSIGCIETDLRRVVALDAPNVAGLVSHARDGTRVIHHRCA